MRSNFDFLQNDFPVGMDAKYLLYLQPMDVSIWSG